MEDDKLFEGFDTDVNSDIPDFNLIPIEELVNVGSPCRQDLKKREEKADKLKKELKGVKNKLTEEEKALKLEMEKKAAEAEALKVEKLKNVVVVDAQNADDRKKLIDLMNEGRIVMSSKMKPFILAEQPGNIYQNNRPLIHTVYCDEIESINIKKYYFDMSIMEAGNRSLCKEVIWCKHNGYESSSQITVEQLEYLINNKFVTHKMIYYSYVDRLSGSSYFMGTNNNEPTLEEMKKMDDADEKNYNITKYYLVSKDSLEKDEDESVQDLQEEVVPEVNTEEQVAI